MPRPLVVVAALCFITLNGLVQGCICELTTTSYSPSYNGSSQEQAMNPPKSSATSGARAFNLPDAREPEPLAPTFLDMVFSGAISPNAPIRDPLQKDKLESPFGFFEKLISPSFLPLLRAPTTTTTSTTTTTTTEAPIEQLGQNFHEIGYGLTSALNAPIKVISGITRVGSEGVNKAADGIVRTTSNVVRGGGFIESRNEFAKKPEDDSKYYEYALPLEPFAYRRPKYFSRECQFRVACEVGKMIKPLTREMTGVLMANKFLEDLQNRYTRAVTYGNLYDDCERYYCVLVQLLGGPVGFAGGISELVNRMVNSDQYEPGTLLR